MTSPLNSDAACGVAGLARATLAVRPLVDVLASPVRVAAAFRDRDTNDRIGDSTVALARLTALLAHVTTRVGAPPFAPSPVDDLDMFERIVSDRLDLGVHGPNVCGHAPGAGQHELNGIIDDVVRTSFERRRATTTVRSFDGTPLTVYTAGRPEHPPVLIAPACGMPAKLCDEWMDRFERDYFVVTWESRCMYGDVVAFDGVRYDADAQAGDLLAIAEHFRLGRVHLMGICGGAVIAILAAVAAPDTVASLTLWHGDYELGAASPKTNHQHNLKTLMAIAGRSRDGATAIRRLLCESKCAAGDRPLLSNIRPDRAPLVLYPYASAELLYRYARLNGALMGTDVRPQLDRVRAHTLVVTSGDDGTTHPEGSRFVAAHLPNATLYVTPHGDHLSAFDAGPDLTRLAVSFTEAQRVNQS